MGYPLKKSSSVFANTEPKAPYGPNNSPKIYTKPRQGLLNSKFQNKLKEKI